MQVKQKSPRCSGGQFLNSNAKSIFEVCNFIPSNVNTEAQTLDSKPQSTFDIFNFIPSSINICGECDYFKPLIKDNKPKMLCLFTGELVRPVPKNCIRFVGGILC